MESLLVVVSSVWRYHRYLWCYHLYLYFESLLGFDAICGGLNSVALFTEGLVLFRVRHLVSLLADSSVDVVALDDVNGTLFVVVPVVSVRLGSIFLYVLVIDVLELSTRGFCLGCFGCFVINY